MRSIILFVCLAVAPVWGREMQANAAPESDGLGRTDKHVLDLPEIEKSAGDLASRGFTEEAIVLLAAVDPGSRAARHNFMLGLLLDLDGRENEAMDAFIKVMTEPDDPAEVPQGRASGNDGSTPRMSHAQILYSFRGREDRRPGGSAELQVPESLVWAKSQVKNRMLQLAIERGGEFWNKAAGVIPELSAATTNQWLAAMEFAKSVSSGNPPAWWNFVRDFPENPLGLEMLIETGQASQGTKGQMDALLKGNPPPRMQVLLRTGGARWRSDNLEFLESLDTETLRDKTLHHPLLTMVGRMIQMASYREGETTVTAADCSRALAVIEKAGLEEATTAPLLMLRVRLALLEGNRDAFIEHINAWSRVTELQSQIPSGQYSYADPASAFESWRKKAGDDTAKEWITRIDSPLLRVVLSRNLLKPEQRIPELDRELAALPQDAPAETRRGLVRMKWSLLGENQATNLALREAMKTTADDKSDPRLALEAKVQLLSMNEAGRTAVAEDHKQLQEMARELMASPDASDREFASRFGDVRGNLPQNRPPTTRWGTSARYYSPGSGDDRRTLPAIIAMNDRNKAVDEAAVFLENTARSYGGRVGSLQSSVDSLSKSGLLDDVLARISLPTNAGLGRREALVILFDTCAKPERARELIEETAAKRPWETYWTVELALRSDTAEMGRLLDKIAERSNFDRVLMNQLASTDRREPGLLLKRLTNLADWAPHAKGDRGWILEAIEMLANGGKGGLEILSKYNGAQLDCFRNYVKLAVADAALAEPGFRAWYSVSWLEAPEVITDAARQTLLSGAYKTGGRIRVNPSGRKTDVRSALEHLVTTATTSGDEAAFPANFRERLKAIDPDTGAWLGRMLAAKTVQELPDIADVPPESGDWVGRARHDAALLRAASLPGRDAWLIETFKKNPPLAFSRNLGSVIRQSLEDAVKSQTLPEHVLALLEAAAGPRKTWVELPPTHQALPLAADLILKGAAQADAFLLVAVLDVLRDARVPLIDNGSMVSLLVAKWRAEIQTPREAPVIALFSGKPVNAIHIGFWQRNRESPDELAYIWALPQILPMVTSGDHDEMIKSARRDPDTGLPDLLKTWVASKDKTLQRRVLLLVAPDLKNQPEEIRHSVTAALTEGMTEDDAKGLPDFAAAQISKTLDTKRGTRIEAARRVFDQIKTTQPGLANQSKAIGVMLAPVFLDDPDFVAEVLAAWQPVAKTDKSGKEVAALMAGLMSNLRTDVRTSMKLLQFLDSLWKDSPPPIAREPGTESPITRIWGTMDANALLDPELWRQAATLSPKLQAVFWLEAREYARSGLGADPALVGLLRGAAKSSEVTRTALEWRIQVVTARNDEKIRMDGQVLLDFARAVKNSGSPPEYAATLLANSCEFLCRMEKPETVMAETSTTVAGIKSLPDHAAEKLAQGVQRLWDLSLIAHRKAMGDYSDKVQITPAWLPDAASLLKIAFARGIESKSFGMHPNTTTHLVLATGDAELLDLWLKFGGNSLVGNFYLINTLLEKGKIAEVLALAPGDGGTYYSPGMFTARIESLVSKIPWNPNPKTFRLILHLSLKPDEPGDEAPREDYSKRRLRLVGMYEAVRNDMDIEERAGICLSLGFPFQASYNNVALLDEFAGGPAEVAFRKSLDSEEDRSKLAVLFVPAVCSRVHAGDLSGLNRLSAMLATMPAGNNRDQVIGGQVLRPLQTCLIIYLNRLDGKLPEASVQAVLAFAKALAVVPSEEIRCVATQLVYFASTDAAALAAGLKSCGLEGVKPDSMQKDFRGQLGDDPDYRAMLRLALLHPFASQTLLETIGMPVPERQPGEWLAVIGYDDLRKIITPELFLHWSRNLQKANPNDLRNIEIYAKERRGDFDDRLLPLLDSLLKRLRNP